jgi:hypothetical protein
MAVLVYVGVGISSFPTRLPDALAAYVGVARADHLRKRVDALLSEATLDAHWRETMDLAEATRRVERNLQAAHPELSDDAVRALAWNFSYANK